MSPVNPSEQLNLLRQLREGKEILDRIFRKLKYHSKNNASDLFTNHERLLKIDKLIGDGWDVDDRGQVVTTK